MCISWRARVAPHTPPDASFEGTAARPRWGRARGSRSRRGHRRHHTPTRLLPAAPQSRPRALVQVGCHACAVPPDVRAGPRNPHVFGPARRRRASGEWHLRARRSPVTVGTACRAENPAAPTRLPPPNRASRSLASFAVLPGVGGAPVGHAADTDLHRDSALQPPLHLGQVPADAVGPETHPTREVAVPLLSPD